MTPPIDSFIEAPVKTRIRVGLAYNPCPECHITATLLQAGDADARSMTARFSRCWADPGFKLSVNTH